MLHNAIVWLLVRVYGLAWIILWVACKAFFGYGALLIIMVLAAGRAAGDGFALSAPWFGYWLAARLARAALDAVYRRGLAVAGCRR